MRKQAPTDIPVARYPGNCASEAHLETRKITTPGTARRAHPPPPPLVFGFRPGRGAPVPGLGAG